MGSVPGIPILDDKYMATMDMWPIEAKEFNRNYTFYENLKAGKFTTTKCKGCGLVSFPPRVLCPECYSENLEYIELPKKGKVICLSEETKGIPLGFDSPLIHAFVEMEPSSPVRKVLTKIVNCAAGELKVGTEVQFVTFEVPAVPIDKGKQGIVMAERYFFAFEPVKK
jgi:uncharacterized OB-fold protein